MSKLFKCFLYHLSLVLDKVRLVLTSKTSDFINEHRCHHWSRFREALCHEGPLDGTIALNMTDMNFACLSGAYALLMVCEKGSIVVSVTRLVCYLLILKLNMPAALITNTVFWEFVYVEKRRSRLFTTEIL